MKNYLFTVLFICLFNIAFCQVSDIGINYINKGYIQNVDYQKKNGEISFLTKTGIETKLFQFQNSSSIILGNNKNAPFSVLKSGMQVEFDGEYFQTTGYVVPKVMKIIEPKIDNEIKGRIDDIVNDYAIVDGNKVKIKEGGEIKGENGYKGKIFKSFKELKIGDIAVLKKSIYANGFIIANKATVEPELETANDIKSKAAIKALHDKYYSDWQDLDKRQALFGKEIPYVGTITNSKIMQDYVSRIGLSLIPDYVKTKLKFMFVVIDNDEFNACVFPNGFALVNTGLLRHMENEAQLAAVLGHEIAHAIYEHSASSSFKYDKAKKNISNINSGKNILKIAFGNIIPSLTNKKQDNDENQTQSSNIVNNILTNMDTLKLGQYLQELPEIMAKSKSSNFSKSHEEQADRVGLYLMVNAGYNPKEASIVWKNVYKHVEKKKVTKIDQVSEFISVMDKQNKSTTTTMAKGFIEEKIGNLILNKKIKNLETHPDNLSRFENLNQLVSLYWSADELLKNAKIGKEEWETTFVKAAPELERSLWNSEYERLGNDSEKKIGYLNYAINKQYKPLDYFYTQRGICHLILKNIKEAQINFSKAISVNPKEAKNYYYKGLANEEFKNPKEAIIDYGNACKINTKFHEAFYKKSFCQMSLKLYKDALSNITKAIEIKEDEPEYYFLRGIIKANLNKNEEAKNDFEKALVINPNYEDAKSGLQILNEKKQK